MKDTEMDGGITMVDGRPMRMVLDSRGVFDRFEDQKTPIESTKATPKAAKPGTPAGQAGDPLTGFKPPA